MVLDKDMDKESFFCRGVIGGKDERQDFSGGGCFWKWRTYSDRNRVIHNTDVPSFTFLLFVRLLDYIYPRYGYHQCPGVQRNVNWTTAHIQGR